MKMEQRPYKIAGGGIAYRNYRPPDPPDESGKVRRRQSKDEIREKQREWRLKTFFGITLEEYYELLELQSGVCALCGRCPSENRRLVVDHCHESGVIRGLLCDNCNTAIGLFGDDPNLLRLAAEYLENTILMHARDFD